ncbi:TetR/AcrR family transcriptional regulator [bacterium]|nr:MAG: TetR/AcrR family transcriptional regulator [bacterium]
MTKEPHAAPETGSSRDETWARIVAVATELLSSGGRDALTTRAVAVAAGVQAPTIYRMFGDKSGLLDAVAEHGFASYFNEKNFRKVGPDPVENLRIGWDLHIGFGLAHPALYTLMYGNPRPGRSSPVEVAARRVLKEHIRSIAAAGRLRVSEERAADMVHASGCGTVLTLLAMAEESRDLGLSETAREAVITAITTDAAVAKKPGPGAAAIALRALLPEATVLSDGERQLMGEWLERLVADGT